TPCTACLRTRECVRRSTAGVLSVSVWRHTRRCRQALMWWRGSTGGAPCTRASSDLAVVRCRAMSSNGAALAIVPERDEGAAPEHLKRELYRLQQAMELRWADERAERDRWTQEDKQDNFRNRLIAMLASAMLGEGAMGARPTKQQVSSMAIEY